MIDQAPHLHHSVFARLTASFATPDSDILRRSLGSHRIALLVGWLGLFLGTLSVQADRSVTLAWDPVASSLLAGYRLYHGAQSRTYTSVMDVGNVTTNTVPGLASGQTYYFAVTAYDSSGLESDFSNEVSYTVPVSTTNQSTLIFSSVSGSLSAPFIATNGTIFEPLTTDVTNGGQAVYPFYLTNAGNYLISAMVTAPSASQNSFYVSVDTPPTDPLTIWDIPVSTKMTWQTVSWRGNGNGDPATAQFSPKVFTLSAGSHQLIIVGRESSTILGTIKISATPPRISIVRGSGRNGSSGSSTQTGWPPVTLTASGQPGQAYQVLVSQDCLTWTAIGTVMLDANGWAQFIDDASAALTQGFYRLEGQ
jgi:hypothetical protein